MGPSLGAGRDPGLTAKLEENLVFGAPFAHIAMCVDDVAVDCH